MKEKQTVQNDILKYLQSHKKGITNLDGFEKFGTTRLGGHIYFLRQKGYNIVTEEVKGKNRYGHQTKFARYRLVEG